MEKNVKIREIQQIISKRRDEDLQWLYREAAAEGIPAAQIMRIWYGRSKLRKQTDRIINFLATALNIDEDYTAREEIQEREEDVTYCVRDAEELKNILGDKVFEDGMAFAPILAVLAWMGFNQREALNIRDGEVEQYGEVIRGRRVPEEFRSILHTYCFRRRFVPGPYNTRSVEHLRGIIDQPFLQVCAGEGSRVHRVSDAMLVRALQQYGLTYKEIWVSGRCCELKQIEDQRPLCEKDVCMVFGLEGKPTEIQVAARIWLNEYQGFVDLFYDSCGRPK